MLALLLLAAALRFHRLGEQSLWYDEGVAYAHSLRSLPELIPHLQRNVHLPAYFALLGMWEDLAGAAEFALRAPSAWFSLLSVALAFALGKRLFGPAAGLLAAAMLACNSFSVYYAQEARMYAMLTAVAGASFWLFGELMNGQTRRRSVVGLGLLNGLGMYTHVAYALVIAAQLAVALIASCAGRRPQPLLRMVAAASLTLALFAPWLPTALSQISAQPNLAAPQPLHATLRAILNHLAFGVAHEWSAGPPIVAALALILACLLHLRDRNFWKTLLPVVWVAIAVAFYLALGLTTRYLRFLLPAGLAFALWMGGGFSALRSLEIRRGPAWARRAGGLAAIVLAGLILFSLLAGLGPLYAHPDFQRDDMRGLARQIASELGPGDAILVSAAGLEELLRYYYRGDAPVYGLPTSADPAVTEAQVLEITRGHGRVFAIFYGSEEQDPTRAVERSLNLGSHQASQEWVGDLRFARYIAAPSMPEPVELDLPFGDSIRLRAYWTSGSAVERGDHLLAGFSWVAGARLAIPYKVFMQLLDAAGRLVAQRDSEPGGGTLPTTSWQAGHIIVDRHALRIPADLPSGEYRLIAGLYDSNDPSARLPVGDKDYVELGTIEVD